MNWDHLRFFLALASEHSLTAAAKSLGVSHTTVLRRIKALESELGSRLFEHSSDGSRLNAAGETLFAEAHKIGDAINTAIRHTADAESQAEGQVVITTTDTLALHVIPDMLQELATRHAGLRFSLKMINQITDINNHNADIAIRSCKEPPDHLIGRQVGSIQFSACASSAYASAHALSHFPDDTRKYQFIVLDSSYHATPFYEWLEARLPEDAQRMTASNFVSAAALCRAGMGIAVLPSYLLAAESSLTSLSLTHPIPVNPLWVLSHPDTRDTERVRLVRQFLSQALIEKFDTAVRN